jgi:hypothetical protein
MSGGSTMNSGSADNNKRWAALDKRLERLFDASEPVLTDSDGDDRDLKAAS